MWRWTEPTPEDVARFLATQAVLTHSYLEVGQTRWAVFPVGYDHDRSRVRLGAGEAVFARACEALGRWAMFPGALDEDLNRVAWIRDQRNRAT